MTNDNEQDELQLAFNRIMAKVKTVIGIDAYQSWFGRVQLESIDNCIVYLSVPTSFLRSWINNHYGDLLLNLWQKEYKSVLRVELMIRNVAKAVAIKNTQASNSSEVLETSSAKRIRFNSTSKTEKPILGSPLDKRYSFSNFIEGPSNRMAFAAARSVAESSQNHEQFNPLFIYGSVGIGKTHLLQAIASEAQKQGKYGTVVYLTAEYFMWRFATAIRDNSALLLKEQLRDIELLIIDDLQFLQGKSIQNEFCHLLNVLLDSAKQIVVAADRPPAELESLDPRVRSRLQRGVTLAIDLPEYDVRLEMLKKRLDAAKLSNDNLSIDDAKLEYIARVISGSGRDIEGAFNQIAFRQKFEGNLSIDKIDELLGQISDNNHGRRIRIEEIQLAVARHYNLSKQDLLSSRRVRSVVKPRQVAMYLAKSLTPRSLPEIGRRFGGRDHTTVLHAIRKIENEISTDHVLQQDLKILKRLINKQAV